MVCIKFIKYLICLLKLFIIVYRMYFLLKNSVLFFIKYVCVISVCKCKYMFKELVYSIFLVCVKKKFVVKYYSFFFYFGFFK